MQLVAARRAAAARLRRHDQRGAAGDPAVRLHGRDAGALAHRRGPARDHGPAVRRADRRARASRSRSSARCSPPPRAWSGATTVTMGLITLPAMLRHGYDPRLAAGTVAATATLAQILPPATVLVLLGDQLNTAYQAAQLAAGQVRARVGLGQRSVRRRDRAGASRWLDSTSRSRSRWRSSARRPARRFRPTPARRRAPRSPAASSRCWSRRCS